MVFPKHRILQQVNAQARSTQGPVDQSIRQVPGGAHDGDEEEINVEVEPSNALGRMAANTCRFADCARTFATPHGLHIHMGKVHKRQLPDQRALATLRTALSTIPFFFLCTRCYSCFFTYQGLLHHIVCQHQSYLSPRELTAFMQRYWTFQKRYRCKWPNCPLSTNSKNSIKKHIVRCHVSHCGSKLEEYFEDQF